MVSEAQLEFYRAMARGGVGLIISSGLFPSLDGWSAPGQVGIHTDEMIPSLRKLVEAVHDNGGKIVAQLMHAGWFGNPDLNGLQNVGPSDTVNPANNRPVRGLTSAEVEEHIDQFIQAGRRAFEAGFDAVQIHGAHGWLVSAFLSPATNHREDEWGGSEEKRANFVIKIVQGIRRATSPDFPILIKLGLKDYHPEGKSLEEGINSARRFIQAGIDAIEISEGIEETPFNHIRPGAIRPYYLEECREARKVIDRPLILVGGMRNLEDMERIVDEDTADAVSLCRPFIMDQYIVRKFQEGQIRQSGCTSCNQCIEEMHRQNLHCVFNRELIHY